MARMMKVCGACALLLIALSGCSMIMCGGPWGDHNAKDMLHAMCTGIG